MFEALFPARGWNRLVLPALLAAAYACPVNAKSAQLAVAAVSAVEVDCSALGTITPAATAPVSAVSTIGRSAKSAAILGGAPSALDRIRQQQAGLQPRQETIASEPVSALSRGQCGSLAIAAPTIAPLTSEAPAALDFMASSRIAIRQTIFTRQWDRVAQAELSQDAVLAMIGGQPKAEPDSRATLQLVNRWVNHAITYAEDREQWASRDYWATASETLTSGRGDCEDLAILKYQLLIALGVDREDMFLTLARDLVRNADHALLVVRSGDRFVMLDNATDAVLPADRSYDYRPTLSFNSESAWLHGATIRTQPVQLAHLSVNATFIPRVIGLSR